MSKMGREFLRRFPNGRIIELQKPPWGYCVKKRLDLLCDSRYAHLPQFASVEKRSKGLAVILRQPNGEYICDMEEAEFHKVYMID